VRPTMAQVQKSATAAFGGRHVRVFKRSAVGAERDPAAPARKHQMVWCVALEKQDKFGLWQLDWDNILGEGATFEDALATALRSGGTK